MAVGSVLSVPRGAVRRAGITARRDEIFMMARSKMPKGHSAVADIGNRDVHVMVQLLNQAAEPDMRH